MTLITVDVVIAQNEELSLSQPAAASQGTPQGQARRDGSRRLLCASSSRWGRGWITALASLLLASAGAWAQNGVFSTPQPVGGLSSTQSVTVTAQATGTVATVDVLTLGASGLDFAGVSASSTCQTASFTAPGNTCTESVTFTPTSPGLRMGAVVLLDASKNVLATAYLSGTGLGGLGVLVPGNVLTMAGEYKIETSTKDGIPATQANLDEPAGVTLDGAGNMYIADTLHNKIRVVAAPVPPDTVGIISTYAGTGQAGYSGDAGAAVKATLDSPGGVALDGAGNLYIADSNNNVIRKVAAATGIITTVAGNGTAGYSGDNVAATSTELNTPKGITVDSGGNLFIADTSNQRIRRVDAITGIITTVAGNGDPSGKGDGKGTYTGDGTPAINAGLSLPYAVAFDLSGNMYIPDSANNVVRMVAAVSGVITPASPISTVVGFSPGASGSGGDGGPATKAFLWSPSGVIVDPAGNLYISDTQNFRIQKVNAATGIIATLVVNNSGSNLAPGGTVPEPAQIFAPVGLFLDGAGDLYFADHLYMLVEQVQSGKAVLNLTQTPVQVGDQSAPKLQTVENDGNAPLNLIKFTPDPNAAYDPTTTTCSLSTPLAADADCQIATEFSPALDTVFPSGATSEQLDGNIDVYGNTVNDLTDTFDFPLDIELVGIATPVNATTLTLTSNPPSPSNFATAVTFTATVASGATAGTPVGSVAFTDTFNGATITLAASVGLNPQGIAVFTTTTPLAVGSHSITATFTPSATSNFLPSTAQLTQVVGEVTKTVVTSSQNPSAAGGNVMFTATVTTPSGGGVPLDGTVTFTDTPTGGTAAQIGTPQTIGPSGIATVSTATLTSGLHTITATYSGDTTNGILGSNGSWSQDVQSPATVTLTSSAPTSVYGNPVTFTVTVPTIGTIAATGTATILGTGLTPTPTVTLSAGTGTFQTSALPVGTYSLTASFPGDNYYSPATSSPPTSQVVTQATTSTTVSAAPNPAVAGTPVTITATVKVTQGVSTPTGNVNFTDSLNNGAAVPLACTPQPTVAAPTCTSSALAAGSHSIVATYVGDTDDAGSNGSFSLTVVQETISLSPSSNPSTYGTPVIFTVTVPTIGTVAATGTVNILEAGQANPIGTVTLTGTPGSGTFTTSSLPASASAAPDVITASYLGGPNYIPIVSAPLNQVVNKATTSTTVAAVPPTGIAGAPVAITATVAVTQGVATPTGTVSFTDTINGATTPLGAAVQLTGGTATINPMLAPGTHSIVATYSGDGNDNTSNGTLALTVNKAVTQTAVTVTPNPALVLATVTFTATVTSVGGGIPQGQVTFSAGTTPIGAAVTLDATGTATITSSTFAAGTYTITAAYGGDANDQSSTGTASPPLIVGTIPTVTDLGASTTGGLNPQVILVAAVLNNATANAGSLPVPTGPVTFKNGSTTIGSATLDSSGVATLVPSLPTGTYYIVASYGGDSQHGASTSASVPISTIASDFNLTVTPASVTVATTENVSVNVSLKSIAGFADTIGLGCASLPAGVNCHFSTPSVQLAANGVENVTLTIDTNNPLGGGTSAMNVRPASQMASLAGLFLPLSLLFGCLFWRFRRRYARSMTMALVLLLGIAALLATGCSGGFTQSSAAPGTYKIQVIGTGVNSNITQYVPVTLTINAK
ncbi:MAG: Ig-like domain repeat protein [Terracidiphilus sp.]|jgi:sugar lactone lactonase YvrE